MPKLITAEIRRKMPGPRAQENAASPIVHMKLFGGGSYTFLVTEAWQMVDTGGDGYDEIPLNETPRGIVEDIILYGKTYNSGCSEGEWGTTALSEIEEVNRSRDSRVHIERERYSNTPRPLSDFRQEGGTV